MSKRLHAIFCSIFTLVLFCEVCPALTVAHQTEKTYRALAAKADSRGSVRLLARLKTGGTSHSTRTTRQAVLQRLGVPSISVTQFTFIPYIALNADPVLLQRLSADPGIAWLEEDMLFTTCLDESVPLVGGRAAWDLGQTGEGQVVAVLDNGFDTRHPFFSEKTIIEACFSSNDPQQQITSLCPDGEDSQLGTGSAVNCSDDACFHGTHVAGIAAGRSSDFSGTAEDADLLLIQIASRIDSEELCVGNPPCYNMTFTSDMLRGLEYVYAVKDTYAIAAVNISMCLGKEPENCDLEHAALKSAVDVLRSAGIATIAAAGNGYHDDALCVPACISSIISVGSTTKFDNVSSFSNSSEKLSLLAPGETIQSSVPGGGYAYHSGTSMAAPHVAGAWAVLKSQWPPAAVDDALFALQSTGIGILDNRNGLTIPRIRIDQALTALETRMRTVSISVSGTTISETGPQESICTVARTGDNSTAIDIHYKTTGTAINGTDYTFLDGVIRIPSGSNTAAFSITPLVDRLFEDNETVDIFFLPGIGYSVEDNASTTITITDSPPADSAVVLRHMVTRDQPDSSCTYPEPAVTVSTADNTTWCWLNAEGIVPNDYIEWHWTDSRGDLFALDTQEITAEGLICLWSGIVLNANNTLPLTGDWSVSVYYNGLMAFTEKFTVADPDTQCMLTRIQPAEIQVPALLPKIVRVRIDGDDHAAFSRGSTLSFATDTITSLFTLPLSTNTLAALVLISPSAESGTYAAGVDDCAGIAFELTDASKTVPVYTEP